MKRFLKWFIFFGAVVSAIGMAFYLYTNFLLDYSLQNLEKALTLTSTQVHNSSPVAQKVYRSLIQDLAIDEAQRDNPNFENMVLLDAAASSLAEVETRGGAKRSQFYLQKALKLRQKGRGAALEMLDGFHSKLAVFGTYFQEKFFARKKGPEGKVEYASIFLLSQAEGKEKSGDYKGAQELYKKFIQLYPQHPDRGFVTIGLAQLLVRENKLDEADGLLDGLQKSYPGNPLEQIATTWRGRIGTLRARQSSIAKLKDIVEKAGEGTPAKETALLRLGLAYLSTYQFDEAEKNLKLAAVSEDPEVRGKAKFYLGWLYKMNSRYDDGAKVLEELLDSPDLNKELVFGLRAQLADLYHLKQDAPKALEQYEKISEENKGGKSEMDVLKETWFALAELEKASIYYFDRGETQKGKALIDGLDENLNLADATDLQQGFQNINQMSLRDRGFEALKSGRVHVAYNLLQESSRIMPDDAWTMSGLATLYLLFGDVKSAQEYALKGYQEDSDEYTTSVLGYVNSFVKNDDKTILMYRAALERNKDYAPARFNLACIYLGSARYQEALDLLVALEAKLTKKEAFLKTKVLNNMGFALWWLGRVSEAEGKFREALALTPKFSVAEHNLKQMSSGAAPEMVNIKE